MRNDLRRRAWQRWQAAAGTWRAWATCPLLAAPDSGVSSTSAPRAPRAAGITRALHTQLAASPPSAVVLDLPACLGVQIAAGLSRRSMAHVVLVLPRWPYAHAILPAQPLLASLVTQARGLAARTAELRHVVFVLDLERQQSIERPAHDTRADNRYPLGVADLPNYRALQQRGIQRVVLVKRPPP